MTLEVYAAQIRSTPIADVVTADILKILSPIWSTKPETASGSAGGWRRCSTPPRLKASGPAIIRRHGRGHLAAILPKRGKLGRGHHAAMAIDDLPGFMTRLRDQPGTIGPRP